MLDFYRRPNLTDDGLMKSIKEWADPNWRFKNPQNKRDYIPHHLLLLGNDIRVDGIYIVISNYILIDCHFMKSTVLGVFP